MYPLAFQTGDKDAVQMMFNFFMKHHTSGVSGLPPEDFVKQLEKEYGILVKPGAGFPGFSKPTEEELRWAFDAIEKNPLPANLMPK